MSGGEEGTLVGSLDGSLPSLVGEDMIMVGGRSTRFVMIFWLQLRVVQREGDVRVTRSLVAEIGGFKPETHNY